MSSEVKREWVFDGTRGEFWTVLILALVFFVSFVRSVVRFSAGHVPRVTISFGDWLVLAVGIVYAFALYRIDKFLSIAMVVTVLETCVRLLIHYGRFVGPSALGTLELLNWAGGVFLVAGLISYLARRLRYESIGSSELQNSEVD